MNIRTVDLNLLPVLRALLENRSVSAAARTLGLTQPAVSNALTRLRGHYHDPLFHRLKGRMEPTPRATEIGFTVMDALARIETTFDRVFEARTLNRKFRTALVSYSGFYFLPALIEKLRFEAPQVQVVPEHMDEAEAYAALESFEIDFAMGIFWEVKPSLTRIPLLETSFNVIMRPDHPLSGQKLTRENIAAYQHVRLPVLDSVDRILTSHGLIREFGATSPNPLAVPFLVSQSDFLAILPSRLAMSFATVCPLREAILDFGIPKCQIELLYHPKHGAEGAFQWFAESIHNLFGEIDERMRSSISH